MGKPGNLPQLLRIQRLQRDVNRFRIWQLHRHYSGELTVREIADKLHIATQTVYTHMRALNLRVHPLAADDTPQEIDTFIHLNLAKEIEYAQR